MPKPGIRIALGNIVLRSVLAPGEWAVRNRVQSTFFESRIPMRLEQTRWIAADFLGNQFSDTQHLITMVGIGYYIAVLPEYIEYRKAVGSERANSTGRFPLEFR